MKKEYIKTTEQKIRQYFKDTNSIKLIKQTILALETKKEELEQKIKTLNLNFDIDIKDNSMSSEGISTNSTDSYFEKNIVKQIEDILNIIKNLEEDIANQKNQLLKLEIKNTKLENIFNLLSPEYKMLLNLKYEKNEPELIILNKLVLSKSNYHRLKKKTVESIYNLLLMYGEI